MKVQVKALKSKAVNHQETPAMTPELFHLTKAFTELYDKARYQPFNKSVQVFSQVQPSAGEFDRLMTEVKKRDCEVRPEPAITLNRLMHLL